MKILNNRAERKILGFIKSRYDKIEVHPGKCRMNFRCHNNSVHEALKKGYNHIALVIYVENDYPVVHFINWEKGKFKDHTLGQWSTGADFYFVQWVDKRDFFHIYDVFRDYRKFLRTKLTWWERLLSDYKG